MSENVKKKWNKVSDVLIIPKMKTADLSILSYVES